MWRPYLTDFVWYRLELIKNDGDPLFLKALMVLVGPHGT